MAELANFKFRIHYRSETKNKDQGWTNYVHSDEREHNVQAKRFLHARNYVHVNQTKHL